MASITMEKNNSIAADRKAAAARRRRSFRQFLHSLFGRRIVILGAAGVIFFILVAVFAPFIATHDPSTMEAAAKLAPPSASHIMGGDFYGRDLFSRLVYGTRVSLIVGVLATLTSAAIGTFLGMLAAYTGGIVDKVLMRACEAFNAIPQIAISMTLITIFGGGMLNMALILCIGGIPAFLRMSRAQALTIMNSDYVLAAKLSGQKKLIIMWKHVFPNIVSPIIVMSTQSVGMTIMMESGLSFLGVGIKVPTPSWGSIINEARPYLMTSPHYVLFPCACLALLMISLNLLGDGIRDALDPSLRGE